MEYMITTIVAGSPGFIEIDETEYKRIKAALANLFELLLFEEKLDLVTENFQEHEAELLSIASREMVFHNYDYFLMSHERHVVARRIVNLLSACRMYLDQSIHHINNIYGEKSNNANLLKDEIGTQYKLNFGYRVMEALRNYTQHRGFPIHSMQFSGEWLDWDSEKDSRLLHTVIPLINTSKLAEDRKFKQRVLDEMLSMKNKDSIDIRPLIRNYVEGIGKIHERVRESIRPDAEKWEGIVNSAIKTYQDEFGADASLAGLAIVTKSDENHSVEQIGISKRFIERRQALESKNRIFVNLHKRYASNEIRTKDA